MKLPRKTPSKSLLRQLNVFYGGRRCVITDSTNNTDWHHLDDNPSNSIFPNLIPLSRDYNSTLELYRRYQQSISVWKGTHPLLTPQFLLIYSNYHFRAGQVQLAYGCSRLAAWLIKLYPALHSPEIDIFDCILQALSCARHAASPILILDIINRDVISILQKRKASLYNGIRLEQEFASLFQEYGLMDQASKLFEQTRVKMNLLPPDQRINCEVRNLRRASLTNIVTSSDLLNAEDMLNEADAQAERSNSNVYVGVSNARAWNNMAVGNFKKARDILEPVIEHVFRADGDHRRDIVAPWNALESVLTYHRLLTAGGGSGPREKAIRDQLEHTLRFFGRNHIQLRPIALELSLLFNGEKSSANLELYTKHLNPVRDNLNGSVIRSIASAVALLKF